jgi:hypothetical protein
MNFAAGVICDLLMELLFVILRLGEESSTLHACGLSDGSADEVRHSEALVKNPGAEILFAAAPAEVFASLGRTRSV